MLRYKIDILDALNQNGYNTTRLRKEKILPEKTIQTIRLDKMVGIKTLERLCEVLNCQPGDIVKYENTQERV